MATTQDNAIVAVKQAVEQVTTLWGSLEKSHPRYKLRTTALKTILLGSFINFICLIIAFSARWRAGPKHVTAWTSVTLGISLLYQILDLTSTPKGNGFLFQKHIPAIYLLGVDTLGFACFLALLIANGIIVAETCATPLYIYNSVPWILLCVIHGRIALSAFVLALRDLINMGASGAASEGYCCAECKKRASGKSTDQDDDAQAEAQAEAESAPLLTPQSGRSAGDVEAGLV